VHNGRLSLYFTDSPLPSNKHIREVVGLLGDRRQFETAVKSLEAAGFGHSDLSVLSSHDSIDAAGRQPRPWRDVLTGLVGELKYEGPLVAAGLIALATGPVGATIAGLIAAGVGGAAIKELLDEVTAVPHSDDFARALAAGSVILWVRADDPAKEQTAKAVLADCGATNIHVNERTAGA
jgi:hypothetical protein